MWTGLAQSIPWCVHPSMYLGWLFPVLCFFWFFWSKAKLVSWRNQYLVPLPSLDFVVMPASHLTRTVDQALALRCLRKCYSTVEFRHRSTVQNFQRTFLGRHFDEKWDGLLVIWCRFIWLFSLGFGIWTQRNALDFILRERRPWTDGGCSRGVTWAHYRK